MLITYLILHNLKAKSRALKLKMPIVSLHYCQAIMNIKVDAVIAQGIRKLTAFPYRAASNASTYA